MACDMCTSFISVGEYSNWASCSAVKMDVSSSVPSHSTAFSGSSTKSCHS